MARVTSEPKTTAATQTDTPEVKSAPKAESTTTEVSAAIAAIFKSYPQYNELWIDHEGGVFANKPANSPSAILYKKPNAPKA